MSYIVEIGKPYLVGETSWPEDVEFNLFKGGSELFFCFKNIKDEDIEAFQRNPIEVGLHYEDGVLFFLHRVEGFTDWSDSPYTVYLVPQEMWPDLSDYEAGLRLLIIAVLVDADTGIVKTFRAISLSSEATAYIYDAVADQFQRPFTPESHDLAIAKCNQKYPYPEDMLRIAEIVECIDAV